MALGWTLTDARASIESMKVAVPIVGAVGLALARIAYLLFAVPEKNCAALSPCPVDPPFWPWALGGVLSGVGLSLGLTLWLQHLQRLDEQAA